MKYLIERRSVTHFEKPVREHHVQLRIAPWDDELQRVTQVSLELEPAVESADHRDGFGNRVLRFAVMSPHERLVTHLRAEVETLLENPFDFTAVPPARELEWIAHSLHEAPRLWDFVLHRSGLTPEIPERLGDDPVPAYSPATPLLDQVQGLMTWIGERFESDRRTGIGARRLAQLLDDDRGGPEDLAHLLVSVLRGWGVPARYAFGYLDPEWFEPDEDAVGPDAEPLPEAMHAWAEILIPGAGWRGFDPSLDVLADQTYIRVAVGRDATDVRTERAAYKGEVGEPDGTVVTVEVTPLG